MDVLGQECRGSPRNSLQEPAIISLQESPIIFKTFFSSQIFLHMPTPTDRSLNVWQREDIPYHPIPPNILLSLYLPARPRGSAVHVSQSHAVALYPSTHTLSLSLTHVSSPPPEQSVKEVLYDPRTTGAAENQYDTLDPTTYMTPVVNQEPATEDPYVDPEMPRVGPGQQRVRIFQLLSCCCILL